MKRKPPKIEAEFQSLIAPLSAVEYAQLEANLLADGCRDALVTWNGLLLDGHNRLEICERLGLPYRTIAIELTDFEAAKYWIITNQFGRRNLAPFQRVELVLKLEPMIAARAKENQLAALKQNAVLSDLTERSVIDTRAELAKLSGLSEGTIYKGRILVDRGSAEAKQRLRTAESTIDKEFRLLLRDEAQQRIIRTIESAAPEGRFHVLVVDPPWPMVKIERDVRPNQHDLDYPALSIEEIEDFAFSDGRRIPEIAQEDAHLFLWTTHRFLPDALLVMKTWDFRYICTFVWHKPGGPQPVGLPQYNCEFALYGRRGAPSFLETTDSFCCFKAPRQEHSRKPKAFYEWVRRVTMEPRVDLFSREPHEGFVQFGNQIDAFSVIGD
jgi:N6-adenosine-specific RNA methylase IME4